MPGKSYEPSNESSSNSDPQIIQSNPYNNTNVNQQREVKYEKPVEEPPPPYFTSVQPQSNSRSQSENIAQNSSLNNQRPQEIPIAHNHKLGRHSTNVLCPTCGTTVHTRAETFSTGVTILLAILLFFFCFLLAFIPFCISSCKRTIHYCPNCNRNLGEVHEFH